MVVPHIDTRNDRRLNRALAHVNSLWFPMNPEVITKAESGFSTGRFSREPTRLLALLKQDFSLLAFVVKELVAVGSRERLSPAVLCNPVELLAWAGPERIREIIFSDKGLPSTHSLQQSEDFQATRLRETAIIASTAEMLSGERKLNPDVGFCRGVLREIGLNLIAWNYPSLYARIMRTLPGDSSLDQELERELGFSPGLLAMRLMSPGHVSADSPELAEANREIEAYESLCQVGEALAHAENPALYPKAEVEWSVAQEYLRKHAGAGALARIKAKAVAAAASYAETMPNSFKTLESFSPEQHLARHKQSSRSCDNRYVRFCSKPVQESIRSLYADMGEQQVSVSALERLIKHIIPEAGFSGGCVFLVDPATLTLSPRTKIGQVKARSLGAIPLCAHPTNALDIGTTEAELIEAASSHTDAIANAFACAQPIVERDSAAGDAAVTTIASSLGGRRRIGVLYLEAPANSSMEQDSQALVTFKALRQALCDALMLD